jgi:hypothetical protein
MIYNLKNHKDRLIFSKSLKKENKRLSSQNSDFLIDLKFFFKSFEIFNLNIIICI